MTDPLPASPAGVPDPTAAGEATMAGRTDRVMRWLRNHRTGPIARLRRVGRVGVDMARSPRLLPALPWALLEALRVPSTGAGLTAPRPPRSFEAERAAAGRRLRTLHDRLQTDAGRYRMALIADDPLTASLTEAWEVVAVRPEDWRATLADGSPDVLLVESAWRGNTGAWQYRIAWYAYPDAITLRDLRALLAWCAAEGVPSVFWDSAGVAHMGRFRESALLFDLIVTDAAAAPVYLSAGDRRGAAVAVAGAAAAPVAGALSLVRLIGAVLEPA